MDEALSIRISKSRHALGNPYAYLDGSGNFSADIPPVDTFKPEERTSHDTPAYSNREIESLANKLLRRMWQNRVQLWSDRPPSDPISVIDPAKALELCGFSFSQVEDLGTAENGYLKVAGLIDGNDRSVQVSGQFSSSIRMFTAAHELGHAMLHDVSGSLHRDRPADGSSVSRDSIEYEADKFASYFLMPAKLVRSRFLEAFGTESFALTEDTAFALQCRSLSEVRQQCRSMRALSRLLASAGSYSGRFFHSLSNQFGVSIEAMAIRLEELDLVEY